jgi:hypothetical protein
MSHVPNVSMSNQANIRSQKRTMSHVPNVPMSQSNQALYMN